MFCSSVFFPLTYRMFVFMFTIHFDISQLNAAVADATPVKLRWVVSQLGLVLRIFFFFFSSTRNILHRFKPSISFFFSFSTFSMRISFSISCMHELNMTRWDLPTKIWKNWKRDNRSWNKLSKYRLPYTKFVRRKTWMNVMLQGNVADWEN